MKQEIEQLRMQLAEAHKRLSGVDCEVCMGASRDEYCPPECIRGQLAKAQAEVKRLRKRLNKWETGIKKGKCTLCGIDIVALAEEIDSLKAEDKQLYDERRMRDKTSIVTVHGCRRAGLRPRGHRVQAHALRRER